MYKFLIFPSDCARQPDTRMTPSWGHVSTSDIGTFCYPLQAGVKKAAFGLTSLFFFSSFRFSAPFYKI